MARIYARKKGKSGSKRPVVKDLSFVTIKKKDAEKLIVDMYNDGKSKSLIGLILRDSYAIPDVQAFLGKSMSQILADNKVDLGIPEDLGFLVIKAKTLNKHLEKNKKDVHNRRSLQLVIAKINRLSKYYKKTGKIDSNWRFS